MPGGHGQRLVALDALRGFNMLWIIGADRIADALKDLRFPGASLVSAQLNHASWNGFTSNDLIYPLFIFLVGVSLTFSLRRRMERGQSRPRLVGHILWRTGLMYLIGMYLCNAGLDWQNWLHPEELRWVGVLQRIALCFGITALLMVFTRPWHQVAVAGALLIGYWILMRFVPVPGVGAGVFAPGVNFANYLDGLYMPGRLYYDNWDPEGMLSTLPAVVNCLGGVFTGYWLQSADRPDLRFGKTVWNRKVVYLAAAGLCLAGFGLLWSLDFPLNKKIWTSSYVLLTIGLSALLMAFFYWLVDLRGHRKLVFPLVVVGLNSLFIYVAAAEIPFAAMAAWLMGPHFLAWLGPGQALSLALATLLLEWLLLYGMFKFKVFIKL